MSRIRPCFPKKPALWPTSGKPLSQLFGAPTADLENFIAGGNGGGGREFDARHEEGRKQDSQDSHSNLRKSNWNADAHLLGRSGERSGSASACDIVGVPRLLDHLYTKKCHDRVLPNKEAGHGRTLGAEGEWSGGSRVG